jgi:hypothetical protein
MTKKHLKPPAQELYSARLISLNDCRTHDKWKSFVGGLGRLIEIYSHEPAPKKPVSRRYSSVKNALRSDMVRIGNDLRIVIAREKAKTEAADK